MRSRGSWYSPELITPEVLQLYCTPLHIQGWDAALLASSKATASVSSRQVEQQLQVIADMPVLIVTGKTLANGQQHQPEGVKAWASSCYFSHCGNNSNKSSTANVFYHLGWVAHRCGGDT